MKEEKRRERNASGDDVDGCSARWTVDGLRTNRLLYIATLVVPVRRRREERAPELAIDTAAAAATTTTVVSGR